MRIFLSFSLYGMFNKRKWLCDTINCFSRAQVYKVLSHLYLSWFNTYMFKTMHFTRFPCCCNAVFKLSWRDEFLHIRALGAQCNIKVSVWNIVSGLCITRNRSPCLLRWSCLQTSEGQRRSEFHLVGLENSETPSTSSIWPSDHREDYRSCARPFYSLVQIIPKALHSD